METVESFLEGMANNEKGICMLQSLDKKWITTKSQVAHNELLLQ